MRSENCKSMVVRIEEIGNFKILMFTHAGQPAVYHDAVTAELYCAQLRGQHPDYRFAVIDFQVL